MSARSLLVLIVVIALWTMYKSFVVQPGFHAMWAVGYIDGHVYVGTENAVYMRDYDNVDGATWKVVLRKNDDSPFTVITNGPNNRPIMGTLDGRLFAQFGQDNAWQGVHVSDYPITSLVTVNLEGYTVTYASTLGAGVYRIDYDYGVPESHQLLPWASTPAARKVWADPDIMCLAQYRTVPMDDDAGVGGYTRTDGFNGESPNMTLNGLTAVGLQRSYISHYLTTIESDPAKNRAHQYDWIGGLGGSWIPTETSIDGAVGCATDGQGTLYFRSVDWNVYVEQGNGQMANLYIPAEQSEHVWGLAVGNNGTVVIGDGNRVLLSDNGGPWTSVPTRWFAPDGAIAALSPVSAAYAVEFEPPHDFKPPKGLGNGGHGGYSPGTSSGESDHGGSGSDTTGPGDGKPPPPYNGTDAGSEIGYGTPPPGLPPPPLVFVRPPPLPCPSGDADDDDVEPQTCVDEYLASAINDKNMSEAAYKMLIAEDTLEAGIEYDATVALKTATDWAAQKVHAEMANRIVGWLQSGMSPVAADQIVRASNGQYISAYQAAATEARSNVSEDSGQSGISFGSGSAMSQLNLASMTGGSSISVN